MSTATDFAVGEVVAGVRIPTREDTVGKFVRRFGHTGAVIETPAGETRVIAKAQRYVPGAEWLSGNRPPVPRQESTPIYSAVVEEHALDTTPEWPEPETEVLPVDRPTVEFARIQPAGLWRRFVDRLAAVRWSGARVTFGSLSALVFVGSGALWTVIR